MPFEPEQVRSMASDAASLASARRLAAAARWSSLGQDERALWGLVAGSAEEPYRVRIDRHGPAWMCSCPSRKRPCKHSLALALLDAEGAIAEAAPPDWVRGWLDERDARTRRRERVTADPEGAERRRVAAERRAAAREDKVAAGVAELSERLRDVMRHGLASQSSASYRAWDDVAARLVDAQAGGLARRVRALGAVAQTGADWPGRMLERIARLHLLLCAYRRVERLEAPMRADVRALVGFPRKRDEILAQPGVRDGWWVLGRAVRENEEGLRSQRMWLWGATSRRMALVLSFAAPGSMLEPSWTAGSYVDAELCFYPSAWPVRCLLKAEFGELAGAAPPPAVSSFAEAYEERARALARQPWIERHPMVLDGVTPSLDDGRLWLRDREGRALRLATAAPSLLLALSGGCPVRLFGEEREGRLFAMTLFAGGRAHPLAEAGMEAG